MEYKSIPAKLLKRRVKSKQKSLFDVDKNGNCYYPPFCKLDVTKCNIDRIPYNQMTFDKYYNEYYLPQKPVIVQLCTDNDRTKCDFSSIIDNSSDPNKDLFDMEEITKIILNGRQRILLRVQEKYTDMLSRQEITNLKMIDPRWSDTFKNLYNAFKRPSFIEDIDIYNDLLGYLYSSDQHQLLSNNWIIFSVISGGATFHADFYGVAFTNCAIQGSKYWVLMPPNDVLKIWNNSIDEIIKIHHLTNYEWFDNIYLNGFLDEEYKRINNEKDDENEEYYNYYHCLQQRGDLLIGPELFYHITVNLEKSLSWGQALITRERFNDVTFNFFASNKENLHKLFDNENDYGTKYRMFDGGKLCVALYRFDKDLWKKSVCNDGNYMEQLNGYKYEESLEYAKNHAQYTDFF